MKESDFQAFQIHRKGRVLTLAMNNGQRLNAIEDTLHHELSQIFRFASRDQESDVVILTASDDWFGAGGEALSAQRRAWDLGLGGGPGGLRGRTSESGPRRPQAQGPQNPEVHLLAWASEPKPGGLAAREVNDGGTQ